MDRLIYTALTAMQRSEERQRVTAHNLSNAQTPGFRREMAALAAGWMSAPGAQLSTRVQSGAESPHDLLNGGRVETTGNRLDLALNGGAWLSVNDAQGNEALTRRGDLRLSPDGRLLTGDGLEVRDANGPIRIGAGFESLRIAPNADLEARQTPDAPFARIGSLKLVTPDPSALSRGADGLFRAEAMQPDPLATVTPGAIERSNVEVSQSLVELIDQSRMFEMQTKLLSAAREMDEGTAALMRVE